MKTQKIKLNETQKKAVQFLILAALVSVIIFVPQLRVLADDGAQDGAAIVTGAFSNLIAIVTALISSIGRNNAGYGIQESRRWSCNDTCTTACKCNYRIEKCIAVYVRKQCTYVLQK